MQHTLAQPPLGSAEKAANPSFNIVIAYEDFETGKHAKRTYDFLADTLGSDYQCNNQMWKFDILRIPKLREIAARDAANADLLILSSRGGELPASVKSWLNLWISQPHGVFAIVALFAPGSEDKAETESVRAYLADIASRAHIEFFAQGDPQEEPAMFDSESEPELSQRTLAALAGAVQAETSPSRWRMLE